MGESDIGVKIVIYKRIVDGDLRKFSATSNDTQSGGGARDLRFSPSEEFFPVFKRMFNQDRDGILRGKLYWNEHAPTDVEVHPPTTSRPNEIRIGRVHECFPYEVVPTNSTDCVLLIVLDSRDQVFPYFTSLSSLMREDWHDAVKRPIIEGLTAQRGKKTTAMGYVDLVYGRDYTNGKKHY